MKPIKYVGMEVNGQIAICDILRTNKMSWVVYNRLEDDLFILRFEDKILLSDDEMELAEDTAFRFCERIKELF